MNQLHFQLSQFPNLFHFVWCSEASLSQLPTTYWSCYSTILERDSNCSDVCHVTIAKCHVTYQLGFPILSPCSLFMPLVLFTSLSPYVSPWSLNIMSLLLSLFLRKFLTLTPLSLSFSTFSLSLPLVLSAARYKARSINSHVSCVEYIRS